MDHVIRAMSLSGMVGRPKANIWYSLQHTKFDDGRTDRHTMTAYTALAYLAR